MGKTLFEKVWDAHTVRTLTHGREQILVDLHLIHEVTSPQAFPMIREQKIGVRFPKRTFATVDHIVPTDNRQRPLKDPLAETMLQHLERNTHEYDIKFFGLGDERQGVVHIIGPELGLTHPGMVIVCGDSHTSTHGAFGSIALGIGTTQVACVLGTGTLLLSRPKVRRIQIDGQLGEGVTAKDIILAIINQLGVKGGIGYAYEFGGTAIDALSMEERMTICNMSIEGGAQCGYMNPDEKTLEYIYGREYAPKDLEFEKAAKYWLSLASDPDATYDDVVKIRAESIQPMVTYGITPGQSIPVSGHIPLDASKEALQYMGLIPGMKFAGTKVDVAFIGSCTNGRIEDLRAAAKLIEEQGLTVATGVKALVVPGSERVHRMARLEGLDLIFVSAGWEWRDAGCSMCLAMNPDKLVGNQLCVSTSNRNFKGRQGSPTGRTVLMSPLSVVACASTGVITDIRRVLANSNN